MKTFIFFFSLIIFWVNIQAQSSPLILKYPKEPKFRQEITRNGEEGIRIQFSRESETQESEKTELLLKDITTENYNKIILGQLGDSLTKDQKESISQYLKDSSLDIMLWLFSTLDDGPLAGNLIIRDEVQVFINSKKLRNLIIDPKPVVTVKSSLKNAETVKPNKNSNGKPDSMNLDKPEEKANIDKKEPIQEDKNPEQFDKLSLRQYHRLLFPRKSIIDKIKITKVDVEFRDGFLEQIVVTGKNESNPNEEYRFVNSYGIGFSTPKNFKQMQRIRLHNEGPYFVKKTDSNGNVYSKITFRKVYIPLGDAIKFDYIVQKEARQYSPANNEYHFVKGKENFVFQLNREKSSEIISGTVFTDFTGLSGDRPNGLLETEFFKKIPCWTTRNFFGPKALNTSWGLFQFIRPTVAWTKIEDNNRDLILKADPDVISNSSLVRGSRYTTPLTALNHQILSLGTDVNIAYLDMRSLKSEFLLNYGFRYRKINAVDSLTAINPLDSGSVIHNGLIETYKVNGLSHSVEATFRLVPEERYGFHATCGLQHLNFLTNDFQLRPSEKAQTYFGETKGRFIWGLELGAFLKTSNNNNNKLFLRWRLNWEQQNPTNNFVQIQFGYTIPFEMPIRKD